MSLKRATGVTVMVGLYDSDPVCRTSFVRLVCADNANHTCHRELGTGLQVCFSPATSHGHALRPASLLPLLSLTHPLLAAWTQKEHLQGVVTKGKAGTTLGTSKGLNSTSFTHCWSSTNTLPVKKQTVSNPQPLLTPCYHIKKDFSGPEHKMLKASNASC